ncbi:hypothetical protein AB0M43_05060 [Longispora sp. NPDC051575]|uniref:hypothetical protein n=1 Tax=Longispora sp. NPDC051575 TaxID=3154943 RepID=UPI00341A0031
MGLLGGVRAAAERSGLGKSTWQDAKDGKSIPGSTWPAMLEVLRGFGEEETGVEDWAALHELAQLESAVTAKPPMPRASRSGSGSRLFLDGLSAIEAFALPTVRRLDLLAGELDGGKAVPGQVLCLIGEGGSGKSVLLKQLAEHVAGDTHSDSGSAVVVITCARIPSATDLATEAGVDIAFAAAGGLHEPGRGLRRCVRQLRKIFGAVYIFIDTLDVIVTEHTVQAITTVLGGVADDAQLVMTCRQQEYEDLLGGQGGRLRLGAHSGRALKMPKLGVPEILKWASGYMGTLSHSDLEKERFIAELSDAVRASTIREVCALPLRLALACDLFGEKGEIPGDLTITGLYEYYWDLRIAQDRNGRRTTLAEQQEEMALLLARTILDQSTERLALTVALDRSVVDGGMKALLSEGAVRLQSGRYEFFHQTYAEFAIALLLARTGTPGQLTGFATFLVDPSSHHWPVARHLLLQRCVDDRYRDLRAAVPLLTAEGARIHLLSAQARRSPDLLKAVADTVGEFNKPLLYSLVPLLVGAPEQCVAMALEISVPLLKTVGPKGVTETARTVGLLLVRAGAFLRSQNLSLALKLVVDRKPELRDGKEELRFDVWLNLPEHLIGPVCRTGADAAVRHLLHDRYATLGVRAQRVILREALSVPESVSMVMLAGAMLAVECPSGMADEEVTELLHRCWKEKSIREQQGWDSWADLLEAELSTRWDGAQVRLIRELARDPGVRRGLLAATLTDTPVRFRDRWVNVARFIVHDHPDDVLASLCQMPYPLGREAVGSATTLSNQLAERLGQVDRETLLSSLERFVAIDPRGVWPALIVLAGPDVDMHVRLLESFARAPRSEANPTPEGEPAESGLNWESVRASAMETWLNTAPVELLTREKTQFRRILVESGGKLTELRARFEGLLALEDVDARNWLTERVLTGPSPVTARLGVRGVIVGIDKAGVTLTPPLLWWLHGLLATRHTEAARLVAVLLLPHIAPGEDTPESLLDAVVDVACARLRTAVDAREDTQLTTALVDLLVILDNLRPLLTDTIRTIVHTVSQPVLGVPDRIRDGVTEKAQREMTSDYNCWAGTVGPLGTRRLPAGEVEALVRRVAVACDTDVLGNRITRVAAKVYRGVLARSPDFLAWLVDELWPVATGGTKLAIAEAVVVQERMVPGHHALALARRSDCPPELAAKIHRWLRD